MTGQTYLHLFWKIFMIELYNTKLQWISSTKECGYHGRLSEIAFLYLFVIYSPATSFLSHSPLMFSWQCVLLLVSFQIISIYMHIRFCNRLFSCCFSTSNKPVRFLFSRKGQSLATNSNDSVQLRVNRIRRERNGITKTTLLLKPQQKRP